MKIGNYVRTKRGLIGKITNINTFREPCMKYGIEASYLDDIWFTGDDDIKLIALKPIYLIEVGDIITTNNLCGEVTAIDIDKNKIWTTCYDGECCRFEDIKSILTKEQFKSMEYKVGEDNE